MERRSSRVRSKSRTPHSPYGDDFDYSTNDEPLFYESEEGSDRSVNSASPRRRPIRPSASTEVPLEAENTTVLYQSDDRPEKMIYVPGQKCQMLYDLAVVYAGRLPKMGVRYLRRRTVRDDHLSMVLVINDKVIGGLTFRHLTPKAAELVFLAIAAEYQAAGYGRWLIANLRALLRLKNVPILLTYADNFAVGFFQKCGFHQTHPHPKWINLIQEVGEDKFEVMDATLMRIEPMEDLKEPSSFAKTGTKTKKKK